MHPAQALNNRAAEVEDALRSLDIKEAEAGLRKVRAPLPDNDRYNIRVTAPQTPRQH